MQILLVGLLVGIDVLARATIGGGQQGVGFLQATDDLGEALATFGVAHALGLVRRTQVLELTVVAILRRLGVDDTAVEIHGALLEVAAV
ncbi:hypothetical protein D3C79_1066510 [compost metagenome]